MNLENVRVFQKNDHEFEIFPYFKKFMYYKKVQNFVFFMF